MIVDPAKASGKDLYFLMISAIVPRPIAWVSTQDKEGRTNLAPFSYFQGITSKPPLLSICIGHRRWRGEMVKKDTLRNIEETGEFVVNVATEALVREVNHSSAEYPPEESEIEAVGLTALPSDLVKPPRIKESPIHFECKLDRVILLGSPPLTGLVIGEVVRFHIDDSVWNVEEAMVDAAKLKPLSRLGGEWWGATRDLFKLPRPDWAAKGVQARVKTKG